MAWYLFSWYFHGTMLFSCYFQFPTFHGVSWGWKNIMVLSWQSNSWVWDQNPWQFHVLVVRENCMNYPCYFHGNNMGLQIVVMTLRIGAAKQEPSLLAVVEWKVSLSPGVYSKSLASCFWSKVNFAERVSEIRRLYLNRKYPVTGKLPVLPYTVCECKDYFLMATRHCIQYLATYLWDLRGLSTASLPHYYAALVGLDLPQQLPASWEDGQCFPLSLNTSITTSLNSSHNSSPTCALRKGSSLS